MLIEMIWEAGLDTLTDGIKLVPFLFLTYLVMEYMEHRMSHKTEQMIKKSGKWGPFIGALLGTVPQCGFSTAAANLYAGRIITLGTLFSVYLSTSDEMLPILISEQVSFRIIGKILLVKLLIGMAAGFLIDAAIQKRKGNAEGHRIDHICEHQNCHCNEGKIFRSAFSHTVQILAFILVISLILNLAIGLAGEEQLALFLSGKPVLGPVLAGIVGLIPNCAASVLLTRLYLEGLLQAGAMTAGLLVGAGVGLLVLFRVNDSIKENIRITILLYAIGVISGIIIETAGLVF